MKLWLPVLIVVPFVPVAAQAASPFSALPAPADPGTKANRLNLRLVQDPVDPRRPVRPSGMIIDTEVAPNATLGVGFLKSRPRKNSSPDWRVDPRSGGSKRAAVTFQVRF